MAAFRGSCRGPFGASTLRHFIDRFHHFLGQVLVRPVTAGALSNPLHHLFRRQRRPDRRSSFFGELSHALQDFIVRHSRLPTTMLPPAWSSGYQIDDDLLDSVLEPFEPFVVYRHTFRDDVDLRIQVFGNDVEVLRVSTCAAAFSCRRVSSICFRSSSIAIAVTSGKVRAAPTKVESCGKDRLCE